MLESAIRSLEASAAAIGALTRDLGPAERDFRPEPGAWSIHDIVCHLLDEERDDFRLRLRLVLDDPGAEWPKIDPQNWPRLRNYPARVFGATLAAWQEERAASLDWLRSLRGVPLDLGRSHEMPWGPLRAGDLLASWVAHDLLHLRQITARRFQSTAVGVEPYSTRYAGEW